eukprot:363363-Chlamydomonas_euryale.AAC.8
MSHAAREPQPVSRQTLAALAPSAMAAAASRRTCRRRAGPHALHSASFPAPQAPLPSPARACGGQTPWCPVKLLFSALGCMSYGSRCRQPPTASGQHSLPMQPEGRSKPERAAKDSPRNRPAGCIASRGEGNSATRTARDCGASGTRALPSDPTTLKGQACQASAGPRTSSQLPAAPRQTHARKESSSSLCSRTVAVGCGTVCASFDSAQIMKRLEGPDRATRATGGVASRLTHVWIAFLYTPVAR